MSLLCISNTFSIVSHDEPWATPDFFSWGGKGQGMGGQILAMEELLMNVWTITGGSWGGKARARGAAAPPPASPPVPLPPPPASAAHVTNPLIRNYISCSENARKLTYSNVEFQKLPGENPRARTSRFQGKGRGGNGRVGERRGEEEKGRWGREGEVQKTAPPPRGEILYSPLHVYNYS